VGRAVAPGSAVACLEATNTETVEGACERAVFASPESVAAASAYMAARLTLLADAHEYTSRRDQSYGLASQVLASRDGCTADTCDAFGLVYDDKRLRANLKDRLFDVTVGRYAVNWPSRTRPLASSTNSSGNAPTGVPAGPNVNFPSAASIPPVSIMNSEPPTPMPPPPAQAAAPPPASQPTNSAPASAARRPPAKRSSGGSAPLSLNPDAKQ
jgi:hypothetical protein